MGGEERPSRRRSQSRPGDHRLLDRSEERELAQRIEDAAEAGKALEEGELRGAGRRTAQAVVESGRRAREEFITHNLRLVGSIARGYVGSGVPYPDLVQEGTIGLIKAVERFDWRRGFKFSTYATWWIRQAMQRHIDQHSNTIRLPVYAANLERAINRVESELWHELAREPTVGELADATGIEAEKVEAIRNRRQVHSLDYTGADGGDGDRFDAGAALSEIIGDPNVTAPEEEAVRGDQARAVREILGELRDREVLVLTLRYGLDDGEMRTLDEVAGKLGVTPERVRQLEMVAVGRLRRYVADAGWNPEDGV